MNDETKTVVFTKEEADIFIKTVEASFLGMRKDEDFSLEEKAQYSMILMGIYNQLAEKPNGVISLLYKMAQISLLNDKPTQDKDVKSELN